MRVIMMAFFLMGTACYSKRDPPVSERSKRVLLQIRPTLERELKEKGLRLGAPLFIRIFKKSKELEVWIKGKEKKFHLFKTYPIFHYSGTLGPKLREGDYQAPEGFYYVTANRMNPWSRFHLAFNIGYPNKYDRARKRTGSAIMVHGDKVSIGCFAMTDRQIEEIYTLADLALRNGQKFFRVHIFPFHMTEKNLEKHKNSEWGTFWQNLREGYDWFEKRRIPPNVRVKDGNYVFDRGDDFTPNK